MLAQQTHQPKYSKQHKQENKNMKWQPEKSRATITVAVEGEKDREELAALCYAELMLAWV